MKELDIYGDGFWETFEQQRKDWRSLPEQTKNALLTTLAGFTGSVSPKLLGELCSLGLVDRSLNITKQGRELLDWVSNYR